MKKLMIAALAVAVVGACGDRSDLPLSVDSGASFHSTADPCHNLPVPSNLAGLGGVETVLVTWTAFSADCTASTYSGPTGYDLQFEERIAGTFTNTVDVNVTGVASHSAQESRSAGDHRVRIRARSGSSDHHSGWSAWVEFSVSAAPSQTPTKIVGVSGSGTYGGTATLGATLQVNATSSAIAGKVVAFKLDGIAVCGGATALTCPTTDADGRASLSGVGVSTLAGGVYPGKVEASFAGDVTYGSSSATGPLTIAYAHGGLLSPIPADHNARAFKAGSVIPVKFQLKDANGSLIPAAHALTLTTVIRTGLASTDVGSAPPVEEGAGNSADSGNIFRYDAGGDQFVFNLATKDWQAGTYSIQISVNGVVTISQPITVR
jgi:hypothetical protein